MSPSSLLVLGGGSDLGAAVCQRFLAGGVSRIVLAGRSGSRLVPVRERLLAAGPPDLVVDLVEFDAADPHTHRTVIDAVFATGTVDVALVAFGVLGEQPAMLSDPVAAAALAQVNYVGAVSAGVALAAAMRRQGHGTIVLLSSVAVERPRAANFVYASAKAGADFFYRGLADAVAGSGVHVVVVRPGQVRTAMTAGRPDVPLTVDPGVVADAVARAVRRRRRVVRVPAAFTVVMPVLRLLPGPVFRRIVR